jgi:Ca2+-binding RTX toxin-like protein
VPVARTASKPILIALFVFAILALLPVAAPARRIGGTARADRVVATKRADVIRAGRGADSVRGRGGADRIYGGPGSDRLFGGAGKDRLDGGAGRDRLVGGAGNDVLNAVDGSRDARIDGGGGNNLCLLDAPDLARAVGCGTIRIQSPARHGSPSQPGSGGSTGGGAPGGGGGAGAGAAVLAVTSASGVSCDTILPLCTNAFQLAGTGARANPTVTGSGGVIAAAIGTAGADGSWSVNGAYSCSSNGSLIVSDGVQQVAVPVSCGTGP